MARCCIHYKDLSKCYRTTRKILGVTFGIKTCWGSCEYREMKPRPEIEKVRPNSIRKRLL